MDKIEKENFEVFDFKFKYLTNEEIKNLYYKQANKDNFGDILDYMTS
jgi:nucleoside diphosphate kinase